MLKLIAFGSLSYLAYRLARRADPSGQAGRDIRLAGGPLSSRAKLQHTSDAPPS